MSAGRSAGKALAAAAAALAVALGTACSVTPATTASPPEGSPSALPPGTPPPAAPPSPSPSPRPGRLRAVADEGHVTYSIILHPGQCRARDGGKLPDPACTPGSADPAVTQATIGATICRAGYTATVRPPASETARAKHQVAYPAYSIRPGTVSELDHLVSLELGGSNDITNLWPEAGKIPNPKDPVENALRAAVCDGRVSLAAAQAAIATNWQTAEAVLGLAP